MNNPVPSLLVFIKIFYIFHLYTFRLIVLSGGLRHRFAYVSHRHYFNFTISHCVCNYRLEK